LLSQVEEQKDNKKPEKKSQKRSSSDDEYQEDDYEHEEEDDGYGDEFGRPDPPLFHSRLVAEEDRDSPQKAKDVPLCSYCKWTLADRKKALKQLADMTRYESD
jgi:hypothetical protein